MRLYDANKKQAKALEVGPGKKLTNSKHFQTSTGMGLSLFVSLLFYIFSLSLSLYLKISGPPLSLKAFEMQAPVLRPAGTSATPLRRKNAVCFHISIHLKQIISCFEFLIASYYIHCQSLSHSWGPCENLYTQDLHTQESGLTVDYDRSHLLVCRVVWIYSVEYLPDIPRQNLVNTRPPTWYATDRNRNFFSEAKPPLLFEPVLISVVISFDVLNASCRNIAAWNSLDAPVASLHPC